MPSAQVIDLNPNPRTELTPLEKTLSSFSKRNRQLQVEEQESDALRSIYEQYKQDGSNLQDTLMEIQTRPGISPTTRVNTIKQLTEFQKHNSEIQNKIQKEAAKKAKVADLEKRRNLTPGSLAAYEDDPKMAEQVTRPDKGTQASRPIPEDQLKRIMHVESLPEFEGATLPVKAKMLRDSGVSKENTDSVLKPYGEEAKMENEAKTLERTESKAFHKESEKFDEEVNKAATSAKHQLAAIEDSRKALASGNVKPSSLANIFRGMGVAGDKISNALISSDEATIQASIPAFLEGRKELFGVRLSDADLSLLQDKLPDMGKSREANTAIINLMQKASQASILKSEIAKQIKKNNGGLRPLGFRDMVDEVFDQKIKPVRMISPAGYEVYIPTYQVQDALNAGAKVQNE